MQASVLAEEEASAADRGKDAFSNTSRAAVNPITFSVFAASKSTIFPFPMTAAFLFSAAESLRETSACFDVRGGQRLGSRRYATSYGGNGGGGALSHSLPPSLSSSLSLSHPTRYLLYNIFIICLSEITSV